MGLEPIKLTQEAMKYLIESPAVWIGLLFGIWLGNYVPMQGSENMVDWFIAWSARKTRKVLSRVKPVKAMFRFFGLRLYHPDPELDLWEEIMWHCQNALVGMKWGALTQLSIDLFNKLFYRIELTSRYKYPIPEGNVALDMLSLSSSVSKMIATGGASLMLKNGQGYKKKPKALMNQMNEMMAIVEQLQLEHSKKEDKKAKFPFPAHALELKQTKSDPALPKVSGETQYNPSLTSGSEAEGEMGDFTKRPNKGAKTSVGLNVAPPSTASSSSASKSAIHATTKKGKGFIKGQTLHPIDERVVIGSAAPPPYNDLSNDSFLIKPRTHEPVI